MGADAVRAVLYRFALPTTLLAACIVRYNGLSFIYLLCLLVVPLLPSPSRRSACAIKLQQAILGLSVIAMTTHIAFQIAIIAKVPYGHIVEPCSFNGRLARQFGFNKFELSDSLNIVRLLAPDVIVFIVSLVCVLGSRKVKVHHPTTHSRHHHHALSDTSAVEEILPLFVALMLLLGGIIQPNVISAIYFLVFLFLGTFWAWHYAVRFKRNKAFFCLKIGLTLYSALHVILLYLYQLEFFQTVLPPSSLYARLFGLPDIVNTWCERGNELRINNKLDWPFYVYPVVIFLVYWILATEVRYKYSRHLLAIESRRYDYRTFPGSPNIQPELPALQSQQAAGPMNVQGTFSSILMFLMRQNYIAALIVMMAWSITYHSWLTFVLLLWACLIWITPFARWFCMVSSPYLVVYAVCLLIIQYVYGMDVTDTELPVKHGKLDYSELGLKRFNYPCLHLGAQTLFTWIFWITLRQHVREKKLRRRQDAESGEMMLTTLARPIVKAFKKRGVTAEKKYKGVESDIEDIDAGPPSDDAKEFMQWIRSTLAKYWILVCCSAFLLVALQKDVSLYQIFYMVIFLFGFIVYQFSVRIWKSILRPLWWFMVVYSILILLIVYTYQFKNMHDYWKNGAHITDNWLHDLGLRQHDKASLLVELSIPTLFSIVLVIQLHFFHKPLTMKINRLIIHRKQLRAQQQLYSLMRSITEEPGSSHAPDITGPDSANAKSDDSEQEQDSLDDVEMTGLAKVLRFHKSASRVLWRFAEIHALKIVSFVVMLVVVQQVSAFNAIFVILLAISMPSQRLQKVMNYFFVVWSSIVVLALMCYQLKFVSEDILKYNCTVDGFKNDVPQSTGHFASNARWIGLHKSSTISMEVRGYLFIVLVIVFAKVVKHHQELFHYKKGIQVQPGILFEGVTRQMADENASNCLKYLCNNFFSSFGFEINLIVIVICMAMRCDAFAVLESLWAATFLYVKRKNSERLWPFYIGFLCIFMPLQYIVILGWPPGLCLNYPWSGMDGNLVHWLYLTDVKHPQNQFVLLADFFQLLVACCQENCFALEKRQRADEHANEACNGSDVHPSSSSSRPGSRVTAQRHLKSPADDKKQYIPPDFMINRTWLDFAKIIVLEQFYWLTLSIVYITAQTTASLFNAGFLMASFFFLWHGQSLYLRPKHTLRKWWKVFIGYNFLVILFKVWLQIASCVYIDRIQSLSNGCVLVQLLNLYCLRQNDYVPHMRKIPYCASEKNTGLFVDSICFMFAIIQYRIFKSIYFKYVIREHRKQSDMATRGAQLVEERLNERLCESNEKDRAKMEDIKASVAKLKIKQEKLNPNQEEPLSHYEALYSGDYYWYESDDESASKRPAIEIESPHESSHASTSLPSTSDQSGELKLDSGLSPPSSIIAEPSMSRATVNAGESPSPSLRRRKGTKTTPKGDTSPSPSISLLDQDDDQQPTSASTSREAGESIIESNIAENSAEDDSADTEDTQRTCMDAVKEFGRSCRVFFEQTANELIEYFNEVSADYRAIAVQLEKERRIKYKEHAKVSQMKVSQASAVSTSSPAKSSSSGSSSSAKNNEDDSDTWSFITMDEDDTDGWQTQDSVGVRLSVAFYYAMLANTDLLCYALMIVNHMYYASILSIPIPFFVFLWGMLSIPRPTKRFWIAVITYVELVIVVKYVLQFEFVSFNDCANYQTETRNTPLCAPRIIGIERGANSTICDLLLLLGLFFHRFALKAHGLWREKSWNEEEDGLHNQKSPTLDETQTLEHLPAPILYRNSTAENEISKTQDTEPTLSSSSTRSSDRERSMLANIRRFIERMLDPRVGTGAVDVYAWMFGCQFLVFLIIAFSWSAFSSPESSKRNFAQIIEENVVPRTFLYMLLTQFILIMVDRYLYLRKLVFIKLLYLAFLVFSFHVFMFLAVPMITTKKFIDNVPAIFMYIFQCLYFGLSAYQVRCGYPIRILGNFLTKSYTLTSGILFQGVLDWVCTDTTLSLSHWLKMEDIYANIYILKCWRDSEKTWPHPRGMKYWASSKILLGGLLVFLLIVVIWFPLLFMSFINSAYISNTPVDATFTLTVGGYQPLFKMNAQQQFLDRLSDRKIAEIISSKELTRSKQYDPDKARAFLDDYNKKKGNIVRVKVLSNSNAIWAISPPSRQFLVNELLSNASVSMRFKYEFNREPNTSQAALVQETVSGVHIIPLKPNDQIRTNLRKILQSGENSGKITIKNLFPTFIQVPASGPAKPVPQLANGHYVTCTLRLRKRNGTEWWEILQETKKIFPEKDSLEIITFNDLVPPLHLSFFASKGIIGLYVGFVWLIGKFVRLFFSSISYRIMFDEMPNVNKVLKLCLEIYMVRESKELNLEEDLFAKLLFLYRSPSTLIKWTKYKRL
eukprot:gene18687-20574_t